MATYTCDFEMVHKNDKLHGNGISFDSLQLYERFLNRLSKFHKNGVYIERVSPKLLYPSLCAIDQRFHVTDGQMNKFK